MDRWDILIATVASSRIDMTAAKRYNTCLTQLHNSYNRAMLNNTPSEVLLRELNSTIHQIITALSAVGDEKSALEVRKCIVNKSEYNRGTAVNDFDRICGCGETLVIDESIFHAHCPRCKSSIELLGMQTRDRSERKHGGKPNNITKELETLDDMLLMIEGGVPEKRAVIGARKTKQKSIGEEVGELEDSILKQLQLQYPDPKAMHIEHVRNTLSHMGYRRLCKVAPYFYYRYTKYDPVMLSDVERKYIRDTYTNILQLWKKAPDMKFNNLPCCRTIIYQIIKTMDAAPERVSKLRQLLYLPEQQTYNNFITNFWDPVQLMLKKVG